MNITTIQTQRRALVTTVSVTVLLIGGAILLKLTNIDQRVTLFGLNMFMQSEYAHIIGHLVLYGTLTAGFFSLLRRRWLYVVPCVLVVGLLQEGAQSLLFGRPMQASEVFDLGIDLLSATIVLIVLTWWTQRKHGR